MVGEGLTTRYEFPSQPVTDKVGAHKTGRRLQDDLPVVLSVVDPQIRVEERELIAVADASKRLSDLMLPAVLHCLEVGRNEHGNFYLVTEGSPFEPIRALIRNKGGLSPAEALQVAHGIALVLQGASGLGIHHLDLTASNVSADLQGPIPKVRIARYGFSALVPPYSPTRKSPVFHGTAEYMAPEVCSGKAGDQSADLYSLGILMYEMVSGKPPFVSSSPSTTIKRQVYEKPLPLHLVKPGLPHLEAYEKVVTRLLAKDPKGRPADAAALLEELRVLHDEAFPDVPLGREAPRAEAPVVSILFESQQVQPAAAGEPRPTEVSAPRETMVFTGLAEAVAHVQAAEAAARAAESAPQPAAEASRPTEAFDSSYLTSGAVTEPVREAEPVPAPVVESAAAQTTSEEEATRQIEAVATAAAPFAEAPVVQAAAPTPEPAPEPAADAQVVRKSEDWFIDATRPAPEHMFPSEDKEEKRESRMFWVIAAAVLVLIGLGIVVYIESSKSTSTPPESQPAASAPAPVRTEAPAPAPSPTPEPAPKVEPAPVVTPSPVPAPPPPTAAELKAKTIQDLMTRAKSEIENANLDAARVTLEELLREDVANKEAKTLLADVNSRLKAAAKEREAARIAEEKAAAEKARAEKAAAERAAAEKAREEKAAAEKAKAEKAAADKAAEKAKAEKAKAEKAAAEKPKVTPPTAPAEDPQEAIKRHIRAGRDAYNAGDYKAAIAAYNRALAIDKNNALVQKLLEQARAKAGQ